MYCALQENTIIIINIIIIIIIYYLWTATDPSCYPYTSMPPFKSPVNPS